jgi:RNA polymerase sigma-70 factor (ECF subfamily)
MERLAPAMLVPAPTLYQRMGRAKTKIREAGIGFDVPARRYWPERMEGVLACLELGYAIAYQDGAAALDADLAPEVRRLAHILAALLPDDPEVLGLAALVEFAESRRAARVDGEGMMIPLSRQDEALWDEAAIAHGHALMARAAELGKSGPRQIIAAIHMTHARRRQEGSTDWSGLLRLYDVLCTLCPGPAAETARALVVARIEGAAAGLAQLDAMPTGPVAHYRPWFSAQAHLLAEVGDTSGAAEALRKAIALAPPPAERRYLEARLSAL